MDLARPITSVVPGLPGRVLGVLGRSDLPLTGRAVAKAIDPPASQAGVANVLAAFVRDGIVLRTEAGRSATYVLNRDHLAAPFIEGLAELRATFVERLSTAFADLRPAPLSVYLYGSAARGDGDAASDIDIALVVSDEMLAAPGWDAATAELRSRVHAMTGNDVSLVEYRPRDLFADDNPIVATLRTEGIRLAGATIDDVARRWAAQDERTRRAAVLARNLLLADKPADAIEPLSHALAAYRDLGDRYGEAAILAEFAATYAILSRWDDVVIAATQAAVAFGDLGDGDRQAHALARRGHALAVLDQHEHAVAAFEEALTIGCDKPDEWRATMHLGLASSLLSLHDWPRARAECERAVGLFRASNAVESEAQALEILAVLSFADDPETAIDAALRAASHFRDVDNQTGVALGTFAAGLAHSVQSRHDEGVAAFKEAVASFRAAGDGDGESLALWRLGCALRDAGRPDEAIGVLREVVERYHVSGTPRDEALALDDLGGAYAAAGRQEEALDSYRQALDAFRASGDNERTRSTLHLLERLHAERRTAS